MTLCSPFSGNNIEFSLFCFKVVLFVGKGPEQKHAFAYRRRIVRILRKKSAKLSRAGAGDDVQKCQSGRFSAATKSAEEVQFSCAVF